jgi:hypothetical protein
LLHNLAYVVPMSDVPILLGLSQWNGRYDALVCDVWGVVHDGLKGTHGACDALIRFRQGGGEVGCGRMRRARVPR